MKTRFKIFAMECVNNANYEYKNGTYKYTDVNTGKSYLWNNEKQIWEEYDKSKDGTDSSDSELESEEDNTFFESANVLKDKLTKDKELHQIWDTELNTYTYVDLEGVIYFWDYEKQSWISKDDSTEIFEIENRLENKDEEKKFVSNQCNNPEKIFDPELNTYTFVDAEGATYFWDYEKEAWFPKVSEILLEFSWQVFQTSSVAVTIKVTDDFLAAYQMNYGESYSKSVENTESVVNHDIESKKILSIENNDLKSSKKKNNERQPAWFDVDDAHNNKVYVSQLPSDLTEDEFVELMSKCGMILKDLNTGEMKIKLYHDQDGNFKGDALCTYIKVESVDLALNILDGYQLHGNTIHVERAKFNLKGQYNPLLKPKKKKKEKQKMLKIQQKLFDWRPEKLRGERARHERVIIIYNMFDIHDFEKDPSYLLILKEDLFQECSKLGTVKKVRNPECIAQVFFSTVEEADACLQLMNNRWFGGRQLRAETWDGKTKYLIQESEKEFEERVQNWSTFLSAE